MPAFLNMSYLRFPVIFAEYGAGDGSHRHSLTWTKNIYNSSCSLIRKTRWDCLWTIILIFYWMLFLIATEFLLPYRIRNVIKNNKNQHLLSARNMPDTLLVLSYLMVLGNQWVRYFCLAHFQIRMLWEVTN